MSVLATVILLAKEWGNRMSRILKALAATALAAGLGSAAALAGNTPSPPDAQAYIIWPKDGQVIRGGKFWMRMGAKQVGIAPAGVKKPNTGHHNLIIDAEMPPFDDELPSNGKNYRHFGGGQTEARIELAPGRHTLQLIMGDQEHVPHNPPLYSERITVIVPPQVSEN